MGPYRTDLTAVLPAAGPEKNLLGKQSKASHPILHVAGMDPELQDGTGSHHFLPRGEGTVSPMAVDGEEPPPTGGKEEWLTLRCCNSEQLFGAVLGIDRLHQLGWGVEL